MHTPNLDRLADEGMIFTDANTPSGVAGEIVLHAARATRISGAWRVESQTGAAGGSVIRHPNAGAAKLNGAKAAPTDYFELTFHAEAGVAETGTLVLLSGPDNPTTINFLPDTHVVVVRAADILGDYESVWRRLRERLGPGVMPRLVNLVTGPSRSADIEQTLLLGAHGPRALHIIVVG